jgi:drug/metabolite transporter (DMT)-like permease
MLKYILLVFAGACSWGLLSTFVKVAYGEGYTTGDISGSQALLGMLVLWAVYLLRHKRTTPLPQAAGATAAWKVMLTGASMGLCQYLYYLSVKWIPASVAIIFLMQFIWMGMLLEAVLFRKKPSAVQVLSVLLILTGTVLASGFSVQDGPPMPLKGVLLALASAAIYSVYVVASGRVGNDLPALKKSALTLTGSTLAVFLVAMPGFLFNGALLNGLARWSLFLAFFGTIVPPVLFSIGIPRIGVVLSAILMTAELPVAVITSSVVLKEQVSLLQWAGVLTMLFAMALPNLSILLKRNSR